jgi:hypothetical protein
MDLEKESEKLGLDVEAVCMMARERDMTPEAFVTALAMAFKNIGPPRKHPGTADIPLVLPGRPPIDWDDPRPISETHPPLPEHREGNEDD